MASHDCSQCCETLKTKSLFATCPTWQFWLPCNFLLFFKFWNSELQDIFRTEKWSKQVYPNKAGPREKGQKCTRKWLWRAQWADLNQVCFYWSQLFEFTLYIIYHNARQSQQVYFIQVPQIISPFFLNPSDVNFRKYVTVWLPQHQSEDPDRRH